MCFILSSFRRGGQWLTCRTHASLNGYGNVSVSVNIDKAHLQKDLRFEYVEDPTITKIEPEWSIYRYGREAHLSELFWQQVAYRSMVTDTDGCYGSRAGFCQKKEVQKKIMNII